MSPVLRKKKMTSGKKEKKVKVAKGKALPEAKLKSIRKKPGSSNVGKYKNVSSDEFAGAAGGSSKYSFPINTKKRAKAALSYAHNAPNPSGIQKKVRAKYPSLRKTKKGD